MGWWKLLLRSCWERFIHGHLQATKCKACSLGGRDGEAKSRYPILFFPSGIRVRAVERTVLGSHNCWTPWSSSGDCEFCWCHRNIASCRFSETGAGRVLEQRRTVDMDTVICTALHDAITGRVLHHTSIAL